MNHFFVFLLMLSMTQIGFSQNIQTWKYSAQAGIGLTKIKFSSSDDGINYSGSLNFRNEESVFSFSYFGCDEFLLFTDPDESIQSIDLKYGRAYDFNIRGLFFPLPLLLMINKEFNYSFQYKSGISYINYKKRTSLKYSEIFSNQYNSEWEVGFGLPVELELKEEIFKYFGLFINLYGNVNTAKSFYSLSSGIYIGEL